jgi:hypothetical protein
MFNLHDSQKEGIIILILEAAMVATALYYVIRGN